MERIRTQHGSLFSGTNTANTINQIGNANNISFSGSIEDERKEFFRWLDFIDFRPDYDAILKKRYRQTGAWILEREHFRDWLQCSTSSLLWCWGPPGIGKSVIASIVIDYLQETYRAQNDAAIAYVYFKHDARGDQTLAKIVQSLIQQLSCNMSEIPATLLNLYRNCHRNNLAPTKTDLSTEFQRLCGFYKQTFIIFDALDECDKARQQDVFDFLSKSADGTTNTKFFITSRRESDIELNFKGIGAPIIPIEARDVSNDISDFVRGRVKEKILQRRLRIKSEYLKSKVISELIIKAQEMFLWVNLQLERLCTQLRECDIEAELTKLPPGLKGTYQRILEQLDEQEENLQDLCKRSLAWIFYATRPLETKELIHAVSIDNGSYFFKEFRERLWDFETIREACANLIEEEVLGNKAVVRPIHFSVREYFTTVYTESLHGILSFTSNELFAYNHLAICCLRYLMIDSLKYPCSYNSEIHDRINRLPLCRHASYLFDHYILATPHVTSKLADCLQRLLKSKEVVLASILQLRRLEDGRLPIRGNFAENLQESLPSDIIYSTALYGSKQLLSISSEWKDPKPSRLAFFHALRAGTTNVIVMMLDKGHDIKEHDEDGIPPLYIVAQSGNIENFYILIKRGADVNASGGYYGNALQAASTYGHEAMVSLLLQNGAAISAQGGIFGNALQAASTNGHEAIVSLLIQNGAVINAQGGKFGNALQAASHGGHEAVAKLLLQNGANFYGRGGQYWDALHAASYMGHESVVTLLVHSGANVNSGYCGGGTALQAASYRGHEAIVRFLLQRGANVDSYSNRYGNALQAASYGGHEAVVRLLLQYGANINENNLFWNEADTNAFYDADTTVFYESPEILQFYSLPIPGNSRNSLQAAASQGHDHIVEILLNEGARL